MAYSEFKRLPFSSLDEMIQSDFSIQGVKPFISKDFGIVTGMGIYPDSVGEVFQSSTPYRIDDFRVVIFDDGDLEVTANLRKYRITPNTLGFMGNGGIIQMDSINRPVKMTGLLFREDYLRLALADRIPPTLNGSQHCNYIVIADQDRIMLKNMVELLSSIVRDDNYCQETVQSLVAAFIHHVAHLFEQFGNPQPGKLSRQQRMFERFIDLVNVNCTNWHTLDYYADRLCVTQRYLGTLVRQASGSTAKQWIDRAIINEAKVALKHSDITVTQLADQLHFPNPSFFCKFFKRETGTTPKEYRDA